MQITLLSPAARSGFFPAAPPQAVPARPSAYHLPLRSIPACHVPNITLSPSSSSAPLNHRGSRLSLASIVRASSTPISQNFTSPGDEAEKAKLLQVAKRLESTARYFKRLGSLGFWGQLVCTVVAAVILSFSVVITGKISSPATFYATSGGIVAAFISVFWSFGYIRLSDKLRKTASDPAKAPPRADVIKSLRNGIGLNLLGMGAAILGMQATVGLLVAKALTSSANPYYQGLSPGYSPVLALDVFLVQRLALSGRNTELYISSYILRASANTILSHFLGLVFSLELLRSVSLPPAEGTPIPRMA